jgi:hypothetical protein
MGSPQFGSRNTRVRDSAKGTSHRAPCPYPHSRGLVIQVLSFTAGDQAGADGPISVYEFTDAPTACYTECFRGGRLVEDKSEVPDMMTTVSLVRAAALSPRASLDLMRRVRRQLHEQ